MDLCVESIEPVAASAPPPPPSALPGTAGSGEGIDAIDFLITCFRDRPGGLGDADDAAVSPAGVRR